MPDIDDIPQNQSNTLLFNPVNDPDARLAAAKAPGVPNIYFNGFVVALSTGDVGMALECNGAPVAFLNMSYTIAKTVAHSLLQSLSVIEQSSKRDLLTTHELEKLFMARNSEEKPT